MKLYKRIQLPRKQRISPRKKVTGAQLLLVGGGGRGERVVRSRMEKEELSEREKK